MLSIIVRALQFWKHRNDPEVQKLFRYSMVSVVSTAVSFAVLALTYGAFHASGEIQCTVFANIVATVPSYYLNRNWVWGKGGRSHLTKEIIPFWSTSAFGIAFSIVGAWVARGIVHQEHLTHLAATAVVLAANLASFGIFWVLKFLIFNRLFHVDEALEPVELPTEHADVA